MSEEFVDQEKLRLVVERLEDATRGLGLTMIPEATGFAIAPDGQMMLSTAFMVRDSAGTDASQARDDRAAFNKMMADNAEAKAEEERTKIAEAAQDPNRLAALLFDDDEPENCSHENMHPDGFCLDCGKGLDG